MEHFLYSSLIQTTFIFHLDYLHSFLFNILALYYFQAICKSDSFKHKSDYVASLFKAFQMFLLLCQKKKKKKAPLKWLRRHCGFWLSYLFGIVSC